MRHLIVALSLIFSTTCLASTKADCDNNFAWVTLRSEQINSFISTLRTISSMPLDGEIIEINGQQAILKVSAFADFAQSHDLDSFDIARRVADMHKYEPEWGITSVQAFVCVGYDDYSESRRNVGTIGHGR